MGVGEESPPSLWAEILEWRPVSADVGISNVQHVGSLDHVGYGVGAATKARRVNDDGGGVWRQKGHRDGRYMAL
ncbi:MAG TPA: hypothetical protein VFC03_11405, partial [Acidimicrobiales bacterium]|nr:hypothetical protein [Acidimicrobiales bacterium]